MRGAAMWRRRGVMAGLGAAAVGTAGWGLLRGPKALGPDELAALHAVPLVPPDGPLATYHLGHSLVGRDMPAMLAQMAGHDHASQLGWGASLAQHRKGEVPGFEVENAHPAYRDAAGALASGAFGAVVVTEMVELRDAIRWHDSAEHLAHWARAARAGNPAVRLYLYETWHRLDDPEGWLERIDRDLAGLWEAQVLAPAMAAPDVGVIRVIPGGQVMAAAARAIEAGRVPGLTSRQDLFARLPDGSTDPIHFGDIGAWLMACAHFAVIYHRNPAGLPHRFARADGSPALPPPDAAAPVLQEVVWQTVTRYPATGLAATVG